jgi:hypothetical protein
LCVQAAATKAVQDRQAAKAAQGSAKSDIAFDIKPAEASEDKEANRAGILCFILSFDSFYFFAFLIKLVFQFSCWLIQRWKI